MIGLFKTEVLLCCGPKRNVEHVEFETFDWVDWFNNRSLLEPIGYIPSAEFEVRYYNKLQVPLMLVGPT